MEISFTTVGFENGPGGGGHFHWRPYQMLERRKKTRKKGIQIRGGHGTRGAL